MSSVWRELERDKDSTSHDYFSLPWGAYTPNLIQRLIIAITRKTVLQRGALRMKMSKLIMSFSSPLDIEFRGCRFRIEARNNLIETGILTRPTYNAEEIGFLSEALTDGGVAVDIGSNIGLYSLPLAKAAGRAGQVLSIDANPDMLRHLAFNASATGLENIRAVHVAVGAEEAMVDLQIVKDDVANVRVTESETGLTRMLPLLRILSENGVDRVDCLKIDIEGHEDSAMVPFLQHASEDLLPSRIVIERASAAADYPGCVAEFRRLGYELAGQTRNNSMYMRH